MFSIQGLDHVAVNVSDLATSIAWYREVLGLERHHQEAWGDHPAVLSAQGSGVALFPSTEPVRQSGYRHFAFRVGGADFTRAQVRFRERGVPFAVEDHGISQSIYLTDPDGYIVELTTYELTPAS